MDKWFEGFEKRQRKIASNPTEWFNENLQEIMQRFSLHSHSGISLNNIIQFYIEKEILDE